MEDYRLISNLVVALGMAFLGGVIARRLGQPVLLGYIVAGVLIGPNTPGVTVDREQVETLANLGVAFLMFALGVEFSFSELRRVRRIALVTGGLQIPLTIALGFAAGLAIGWEWQAAALLGGGFAISSTIVALKLAGSRGEVDSPQARTALGLGVVQDLSLVPMIALLPVLAGSDGNVGLSLLKSLGTATVALLLVIVVGTRVVPRILYAVARTESRELFLLTIVLIALGTAVASEEAGLSLALGAFLAGLVVSESEFDSQVLAEIIPLRDIFATLFFVAVGMLLEPRYVLDNWLLVLALVVALVVGKLLITGGAYLAAGVDHRTSTLASILMAQMGEFSFVLAGVGVADGILTDDQYGLILTVALGSILVAPALLRVGSRLVTVADYLPGVRGQEAQQAGEEVPTGELRGHVILCGYGRVGTVLGDVLSRQGYDFVVIELNPAIVRELRANGVPAFYGDAGNEELLRRAGIERASVLVVTVTDLLAARATVRTAHRIKPEIEIITRATARNEVDVLREAGADEIIQPEIEAGLEFVHHVLGNLGMSERDTTRVLTERRALLYQDDGFRTFAENPTINLAPLEAQGMDAEIEGDGVEAASAKTPTRARRARR